MLKKIYINLIIILIIISPLINSSFFDLFWIHLWLNVAWNYEFSKVIFFNILSSIIILLFSLDIFIKKIYLKIPSIIYYWFIIFILSALLSISPYISILWNTTKDHSLIMYINLLGLFIFFLNLKKENIQKILKYSLIWLILSSIIAIWQLYYPSFNYWNLSNRALWTFWHPDYLALYLLIYIPLLYKNIFKLKEDINISLIILTLTTITLTKSLTWIILTILYSIYFLSKNIQKKYKKILYLILIISIILITYFIIYNFWFSKLHSFFSRFFLWKNTFLLSIENIKTLIIGHWFETLSFIFNKNKSPYLYIFENIWFTADRPHNILLLFLYNNWIFWLFFIIYIIYFIYKSNKSSYKESLILSFLFLLLNFSSITSYILIILLLSIITKKYFTYKITNIFNKIFIIIIIIISFIWSYFSIKLYIAENLIYKWKIQNIESFYKYNPNYYFKNWKYKEWLVYSKIKTELYYKSKIYFWENINNWCIELTKNIPSVENYFFCWNILWGFWNKFLAQKYYKVWLKKLPNLWNNNSIYYKNIIIKDTINWNRFFSPKYSNIKQILNRVWIKIK